MEYDKAAVQKVVRRLGEVFFVLDSDREYIIHGVEGFEFVEIGGQTFIEAEGFKDDEYTKVEFPLDAIEHHYTHREL